MHTYSKTRFFNPKIVGRGGGYGFFSHLNNTTKLTFFYLITVRLLDNTVFFNPKGMGENFNPKGMGETLTLKVWGKL